MPSRKRVSFSSTPHSAQWVLRPIPTRACSGTPLAAEDLLLREVQADAEKRSALFQRVGRGALQIEANVSGVALLRERRSFWLPNCWRTTATPSTLRGDLAQTQASSGLGMDAVLADQEAPAAHAERLVQTGDTLLARNVLQLDAATNILEVVSNGAASAGRCRDEAGALACCSTSRISSMTGTDACRSHHRFRCHFAHRP